MTSKDQDTDPAAWRRANRARWDEAVAIHRRSPANAVDRFLEGACVLLPIEAAELGLELGNVTGKRLLHLQCHFGLDTLCWARRGAVVTGLDLSAAAIAEAKRLAEQAGIPKTAFVESDVYDARAAIVGDFDIVFTSWGTVTWLADIARWARTVAAMLAPGGLFYFLDGHPAALMLEESENGGLESRYDYFQDPARPLRFETTTTYTGDADRFAHTTTYEWVHPLGAIVQALIDAGLEIALVREHNEIAWRLFPNAIVWNEDRRMGRLRPGLSSVPLALSIAARKRL